MKENRAGVDAISGYHGVAEALRKRHPGILSLWVAKEKGNRRARELIGVAEEMGIPVSYRERSELDRLLPGVSHQGIVARVEQFHYASLDHLIRTSLASEGHGLLVIADHITDEGNLGAIVRTAAFFGSHGLILPKDRSAKVSGLVVKRSAGALVHLPVAQVVNLPRTLDELNKQGFWIIGAAGEGTESVYGFDWNRDVALVLGREDRGLTRAVRERCHQLVKVPGAGRVESLNVAVACGAVLSEIRRQRLVAEDTRRGGDV
ncbi:MAG: 23S rRNA (guanosine(2251)-2'-O)-methyltransferase RlmB [Desulfatiglandales bacterium]